MKEPKFKDYKEKQRYYKEKSKMGTLFYDSGKRTTRKGVRRMKGVSFVNEEKRMLKEEKKLKKLARKNGSLSEKVNK